MKTFTEIQLFNSYGNTVLQRHPNTKIAYAIKKVTDKTAELAEELSNELADIDLNHCYTNQEGVIEYDIVKDHHGNEIRQYKFTKEAKREKIEKERELVKKWKNRTFDIKPYFATEIPKDLTDDEREALTGFVMEDNVKKPENNIPATAVKEKA